MDAAHTTTAGDTAFHAKRIPLREIFRTFLVYGLLGFGGPAAHLALFERDLVTRRQWLSREHFLNLLAAINLVPGPNSTEMAFHIGLSCGGFPGMILAGIGFIGPAVSISIGLAMLYVYAGTLPAIQGLLLGLQPVILVLILSAAYRLGVKAIDNRPMRIILGIALIAAALTVTPLMGLFGQKPITVSELAVLLACGFMYVLYHRRVKAVPVLIAIFPAAGLIAQAIERITPSVLDLFARFFVIGATLFGSGYVLAAYMDRTFVQDTGWMTSRQVVDALVIGQSTPGPVSSTSAAAGYIMTARPDDALAGIPAAILSAVGVFMPAFIIVLILGKTIPTLRRYQAIMDFLKGVNAGVIALLIATFLNLAYGTLVRPSTGLDVLSVALTGIAFYLLEGRKWSPPLLIALGIGVGLARSALGWL